MPNPSRRRWTVFLAVIASVLISVPTAVWASHQFTDVPNSHTFHNAIAWMKDNGITVGCNPPQNTQFCPDDNVTRGQISAFMKRLAESQVVDAGLLDGLDSTEVQPLSAAQIDAGVFGTAGNGPLEVNSVEITVPVDGVLNMSGTVLLNPQGAGPADIGVFVQVDGSPVGNGTGLVYFENHAAFVYKNHGWSTSQAVTAGTHTVTVDVAHASLVGAPIAGNLFYNLNNLTVSFVPGGTTEVVGVQSEGDSVGG
jgi:hypothetical protein